MRAIFQRVVSGVFHRGAALPAPAAARPATPQAAAASNAAPVGAPPAPADLGALARRPLIATNGNIVGFEFRAGAELQRRVSTQVGSAAQTAYAAALLNSAQWIAQHGRLGLARLPIQWLAQVPARELGAGTMIALEQNSAPDPQAWAALEAVVLRLRAQGVKVGWDVGCGLPLVPDFVLLCQGNDPMAPLIEATKMWPSVRQGASLVATDIASIADLEWALQNGVQFACTALTAMQLGAERLPSRAVPPELRRIGQLLQRLVAGDETAAIADDIKGDVGLSFRLLSRLKSAQYSQLRDCSSIEQAVLMLGRNELYRWLSLLMVQFAGARQASGALQEITLWRSRLLELLAVRSAEPAPTQLFTLGLASMLAPLLRIAMTDVVDILRLPVNAEEALIRQSGPWFAYLQLVEHVQSQSPDVPESLCERFGGMEAVTELSAQAWDWAAENVSKEAAAGG